MNGSRQDVAASVTDILLQMSRRGIRVWNERGVLRYQAPKGEITRGDLEELRRLRGELCSFLPETTPNSVLEMRPNPRRTSDLIPLTFAQQLRWRLFELDKRPSSLTIACAVRLCGHVEEKLMLQSLAAAVRRHESLRTRIVFTDGVARQQVDEFTEAAVKFANLSGIPTTDREDHAAALMLALVGAPVELSSGPLFCAILMKLGYRQYQLGIAMDHLISDARSTTILLRDIAALYDQALTARAALLPEVSIQFADYAVWQRRTNQLWRERHEKYWNQRLAGAVRTRIFAAGDPGHSITGYISLPIDFGRALSRAMCELSRRERVTIAMTTLSVYTALLIRWCKATDIVVPFITMGRNLPQVENTIGYFASRLFLRLQCAEDASFLDLMRIVIHEYSEAYSHDDSGRIAARDPPPEYLWNSSFNWSPVELNGAPALFTAPVAGDDGGREATITASMVSLEIPFPDDMAGDGEGGIALTYMDENITGMLAFRADRSTPVLLQLFRENLLSLAQELTKSPDMRIGSISLLLP
jgi:Condensation domain/TubC N-terminal docking domain